jgi:hypothetical protein
MANVVTTSIVVQFSTGAAAQGLLLVEVDDRDPAAGGLNGGKTSFAPGDPVNLLLYKTANVTLNAAIVSLGSIAAGTSVTVAKEEDVIFAGEVETTTKYPVSGGFSYTWVGASLGTISLVGENTLRVPEPAAGSYAVGVAKVKYNATATVYKITHSDPGLPEYSIVAFFAGATT